MSQRAKVQALNGRSRLSQRQMIMRNSLNSRSGGAFCLPFMCGNKNNVHQNVLSPMPLQRGNATSAREYPIEDTQYLSHYDFDVLNIKNIICYSDEEGGAPFDSNDNELTKYVTIQNGIISDLKLGNALVFLGDVQDNGEATLTLLKTFVELKEKYSNKVILIAGNRDVNKLRFADECFITRTDGKACFDGESYTSFHALVSKICDNIPSYRLFTTNDGLTNVLEKKPWTDPGDSGKVQGLRNIYSNPSNFERINDIYKQLMGAGDYDTAVNMIFKNMQYLGILDMQSTNQTFKCVAVTLLNMIMSREWDERKYPFISNARLESYNGLYIKYLKLSHVCATFKFNNKISIVSHAGIPETSSFFTSVLGLQLPTSGALMPTYKKSYSLAQVVGEMDKHIKVKLNEAFQSDERLLLRNMPIIAHLINMSANTGLVALEDSYVLKSDASSIVGFQDPRKRKKPLYAYDAHGGYSIKDISPDTISYFDIHTGNAELAYNIYGHQPRGLAPSVNKVFKTWHICVDVSKIDGQTNNKSYAILVIQRDRSLPESEKAFVLGKIDLSDHKNPTNIIYVENTLGLNPKSVLNIYFYMIDINDLFKQQTDDVQIHLNIQATMPPNQTVFKTLVFKSLSRFFVPGGFKNIYYICDEKNNMSVSLELENAKATSKQIFNELEFVQNLLSQDFTLVYPVPAVGGRFKKMKVLGKMRTIIKQEGRNYIMFNRQKMKLSDARKLEKAISDRFPA